MRTLQIEKRIAAAVSLVRRLGFRLVADRAWGVHRQRGNWLPTATHEVCICGAIALAENPPSRDGIITAVANKLGITKTQAASLSDGFEGDPEPNSGAFRYTIDKAWYRIGRKFRRRADEVRN